MGNEHKALGPTSENISSMEQQGTEELDNITDGVNNSVEKRSFEFYQDIKLIVWNRQHFSIRADTEEEAIKQVERYKTSDVTGDIHEVEIEVLAETEEMMDLSDNDGQSTIQLYLDVKGKGKDKFLGSNGSDLLLE